MDVIHFTLGATDPLRGFFSRNVLFVPLADGTGECHVSCAHLGPFAKIDAPSLTHAAALLIVHGKVTIETDHARIVLSGGMGCMLAKAEGYTVNTDDGAIILIVEAGELVPHPRGISSPQRIAGQTWPGDQKKD
jgi:hypothetical protein